jgi:hypothetical protein
MPLLSSPYASCQKIVPFSQNNAVLDVNNLTLIYKNVGFQEKFYQCLIFKETEVIFSLFFEPGGPFQWVKILLLRIISIIDFSGR